MADIDKSKYDRNRYFACLAMMMMDLFELSESFYLRGYTVKKLLNKYSVDVGADKKRCRVGLLLPKEVNSDGLVREFHRQLLRGYKQYQRVKNHVKAATNGQNRQSTRKT